MKNKLSIRIDGKWHEVWGCMTNTISHIVMPENPEDVYFGPNPPTVEQVTDQTPVYGHYTHDQLSKAFDKVKDKKNWKNPIDALVDPSEDIYIISLAISYFTGSPSDHVTVKRNGKKYIRVMADGYYVCIGA